MHWHLGDQEEAESYKEQAMQLHEANGTNGSSLTAWNDVIRGLVYVISQRSWINASDLALAWLTLGQCKHVEDEPLDARAYTMYVAGSIVQREQELGSPSAQLPSTALDYFLNAQALWEEAIQHGAYVTVNWRDKSAQSITELQTPAEPADKGRLRVNPKYL